MAIYRLLQNSVLGPTEIQLMTDAYEHALRAVGIADRSDPLTEAIAMKIVAITKTGEREPALIAERAIKTLGIREAK